MTANRCGCENCVKPEKGFIAESWGCLVSVCDLVVKIATIYVVFAVGGSLWPDYWLFSRWHDANGAAVATTVQLDALTARVAELEKTK